MHGAQPTLTLRSDGTKETLSPHRSLNLIVGRQSGVYTRGGLSSFFGPSGQPNGAFLAHEMLHYTTRKNDEHLANDLGVQRRGDEDWSAALSRYINSDCDPAQK